MDRGDFGSGSWCTVEVGLDGWNKNFADVVVKVAWVLRRGCWALTRSMGGECCDSKSA